MTAMAESMTNAASIHVSEAPKPLAPVFERLDALDIATENLESKLNKLINRLERLCYPEAHALENQPIERGEAIPNNFCQVERILNGLEDRIAGLNHHISEILDRLRI